MSGAPGAAGDLVTATGVVAGDEGPTSGPVIVLVPSLCTTQRSYDRFAERLVCQGYRVIRPDIRGHGQSERSAPVSAIDDIAEDLGQLVDRAGVADAVVFGCSIGAMAAIRFAARFPDRTRRLILTGADSSFGPPALWENRIRIVDQRGLAGLVDGAVDRWVTTSTRRDRQAAVAVLRRDMLGVDPAVFVRYANMLITADVEPDLAALEAPTLVIVGENDSSSPVAAAQHLVEAVGESRPVIVPGANHLLHLDALDRLVELTIAFSDAPR